MSVSALSGAAQVTPDGTLSVGRASSHSTNHQALAASADPRGGQQSLYGPVVHAYTFPSQMASDGRYLYQNSQEAQPAPYPYTHYPPSTYDSAQYASNAPRPVRNNSSQSHSPNQPPAPAPAAYNPPPSGYPNQPPYPPGQQFGVAPSASNQQWAPSESWSHYPQPFAQPNPPIPEAQSFNNAGNGRAEAPPSTPGEHRVSSGATKPKSDPRRDERAHRPVDAAPPPKVRKTRDPEPPAPPPPPAPLGLDFIKLVESYRLIIDSSNAIANDPGQGRPEALERMLQAASYGAQALDAAAKRVALDVPQEPREHEVDEGESSSGKVVQKVDQHPTEGQTCLGCNATSTPEWRRGPMGPRTLCNACGLVYAKLIKKRTREPGRSRGAQSSGKNAKSSRNESGQPSSDSDDDGSYTSQDRRSDVGDQGGRE